MSLMRFCLLPFSLCLISSATYGGSEMRLFAAIDSTGISTKETDVDGTTLNEESGNLLGGGVGFEWISNSGVYYGGTLDRGEGDVEYKGLSQLGTPINNGTSYFYYWRPKVYAGKEVKDWWFKPRLEIEVGGQLKERHIDPRTEGISGYKESYKWWYTGVGFSLQLLGDEDWQWRAGLNYRTMLQPTNDVDKFKRDITLGSTDSVSFNNSVYLNLGEELFLGVELNITQTEMERSRTIYDGVLATEESSSQVWVTQPESKWRDINFRVAMSKRFEF